MNNNGKCSPTLVRLLQQERQLWQSSAFLPYTTSSSTATSGKISSGQLVAIEGTVSLLIGPFTFVGVQFYTVNSADSACFASSPNSATSTGSGGRRGSFAALQQLLDLTSRKETFESDQNLAVASATMVDGNQNSNASNTPGIKEVLLKNPGLVQLLSGGGNGTKKSGPIGLPGGMGKPLIFQFHETPDSYWLFPSESASVQRMPPTRTGSTLEDLSISFRLNPACPALSLINLNGGTERKIASLPNAKLHMIVRGATESLTTALLHSCYDPLTAFSATLPADLPFSTFGNYGFKETVLPCVPPHGIVENLTRIVKGNGNISILNSAVEEPQSKRRTDPKPSTVKRKKGKSPSENGSSTIDKAKEQDTKIDAEAHIEQKAPTTPSLPFVKLAPLKKRKFAVESSENKGL